ncbi:hypothetical protein B0H19DRAFT_1096303, partial [Mycena capillaripes]
MTSALTRLTENMARASGFRGRLVFSLLVLVRAIRRRTSELSVCLMEFLFIYFVNL